MQFKTLAKCGAIMSIFSAAAFAHHSNAMYQRDKVIEVTGTVREFQWTNPHTFIELTVDGKNFSVEGPTPGVLRSQGWKFNSLKPGDKIVVKMHPLKQGDGGGLISVVKEDGSLLRGGNAYTADKEGK